jgi:hypothetical protein
VINSCGMVIHRALGLLLGQVGHGGGVGIGFWRFVGLSTYVDSLITLYAIYCIFVVTC